MVESMKVLNEKKKHDSSLLQVFDTQGCARRLSHTEAMPKAFAIRRYRLEAKPRQSLKWHSQGNQREKSGWWHHANKGQEMW